jgi:hypothetical protein
VTSAIVAGRDTGDMFAAIDAQDGAAFVAYLTEDAIFRFGGFFATIAGCKHTIFNSLRQDDTVVCEGEVAYQRHDGREVILPFTDVFEYSGDLISQYKIYIDVSPLYAE